MACQALALLLCFVLCARASRPSLPVPCGTQLTTLDFKNALPPTHNNLGGQGPTLSDPAEILYEGLGNKLDGTPIGLRITTVGSSEYKSANVGHNGLHHSMGQINVAGSSQVLLEFQFVNTDDLSDLCIGNAGVTFQDVDGYDGGSGTPTYEVISVCPADKTLLSDDYNPPNSFPTHLEKTTEIKPGCDAWRDAELSMEPDGVVNPTDPANLTEAQLAHTLSFLWDDLCSFQVYFASEGGTGTTGRNFWFTGLGAQASECPTTTIPELGSTTSMPGPATSIPDLGSTTSMPELGLEPCEATCNLCNVGDTCAEAIACKTDLGGFGSSDPDLALPDNENSCSVALEAVHLECPACGECAECPKVRLLIDAPHGSGAAVRRGPLVAALAATVCSLAAASGVAAALVVLRQRASRSLAVATDAQSETDDQLS